MSDFPEIESTEENLKMVNFMNELLVVLKRHGLATEEGDVEVPHDRAANVMISEVHDWYRSGRMDVDETSFTEYCERVQEANYEADDINGEFTGADE